MDVREKLVELLAGCPCESDCEGMVGSCPNRRNGNCNEIFKLSYCAVSKLAQHLIAHGVTVQECGEWEEIEDDWSMETIYKCSACKEEFVTIDGTPADNLWNYCPHCGAKMMPQPPKGE